MSEFRPTSLHMLAASIVPTDPWVMAAAYGAVTLTPRRMLPLLQPQAPEDQHVLLSLTDLGHEGRADVLHYGHSNSPLPTRPDIVLLLPWSMLSTVAELDIAARSSTRELSTSFAPEDWIKTWHHFIEVADTETRNLAAQQRADLLRALPFAGVRHYVLGEPVTQASSISAPLQDLSRSDP